MKRIILIIAGLLAIFAGGLLACFVMKDLLQPAPIKFMAVVTHQWPYFQLFHHVGLILACCFSLLFGLGCCLEGLGISADPEQNEQSE